MELLKERLKELEERLGSELGYLDMLLSVGDLEDREQSKVWRLHDIIEKAHLEVLKILFPGHY